jgi:hypothetical protein
MYVRTHVYIYIYIYIYDHFPCKTKYTFVASKHYLASCTFVKRIAFSPLTSERYAFYLCFLWFKQPPDVCARRRVKSDLQVEVQEQTKAVPCPWFCVFPSVLCH